MHKLFFYSSLVGLPAAARFIGVVKGILHNTTLAMVTLSDRHRSFALLRMTTKQPVILSEAKDLYLPLMVNIGP